MKNAVLRRPLSFVLAVFLLFSLLPPVQVWAADLVTVYIDPAAGADTNDGTEAKPVKTLEAAYEKLTAGGGTVVFLSNLSISANTFFPACQYPVTITSKTGKEGIVTTASLRMQGDTTFRDITLTFNGTNMMMICGEGNDLTIDTGVTTVDNSTAQINLVATKRFDAALTASPTLTVRSGKWDYIYATHGNSLTGDVTVTVLIDGGNCTTFAPSYNATVDGNVNVTVKNSTISTAYLEPTHADGVITGNLNVTLGDNVNVTNVIPSKGTVEGATSVILDGANQTVGTLTGTGTGSSLVLRSGVWDGSVTGFGTVAVDVPEGKTLSLKSALTANTVACAGTLDFQPGGSLTATTVTGTVNCTLTGKILTNKAFVTAPVDSDIRFPENSNVTCEDGKWMILDKENFKGLVIKADSAVTMYFYAHYLNGDAAYTNRNNYKITPDYTTTEEGVTTYYFSNYEGQFCYIASQTDHYTIRQQIYMSAEEADRCTEHIVQMNERGDGWDHAYYFGQTDELLADQETDENQKWHQEVDLVTPVFTLDKPAHQMTTQEELKKFIDDLDKVTPHMYVFSIGQSKKYQHDIPIVFFTKTDLSNCTTLEEVAAALEEDGLPNVGYKAQMHGDEHAAGEGALGVIELLSRNENEDLLDTVNIYVMPRINPDGAQECQRNLRAESFLDKSVAADGKTQQDPNRHMLSLAVHEARLYLRTVQLFDPIAELDGHERQRYSMVGDIQIGNSWRGGSDKELLNIQVELVQSMFDALEDVDLTGAWYTDKVNAAQGNNTRGYASLQGRIHILMETRGIYIGNEAYGSRTASQIVSAMAYLRYCAENAQTIKAAVEADQQRIAAMGKTYEDSETIMLSVKNVAVPEYNHETEQYDLATGSKAYAQKAYIQLPDKTRVAPTAYVIPKDLPKIDKIIELMELQEIAYYELPANAAVFLQQYSGVVDETRVTSNVTLSEERCVVFPAGAYVMQMDQVNGYVLGHLMEPDTVSFDLVEQGRISVNEDGTFPIYRYIRNLTEGDVGIAYTAAQAAPTGLTVTHATSAANDGVISGLDPEKAYEYRSETSSEYTALAVGTTQITGLRPDTYYIRLQADKNGLVGADGVYSVSCAVTMYVSAADGNDENAGTTEAAALKTLEAAYAKLSALFGTSGNSEGTIILMNDYTIKFDAAVNLPAHTWPVTILGNAPSVKLIFNCLIDKGLESVQQLRFHGPTTLDNFVFHSQNNGRCDYIYACGHKMVIGENLTCTTSKNKARLVAGDYRTAVESTDLTVKGGSWDVVCSNGLYSGNSGTAKLTVTGGNIGNIWQCNYGNSAADMQISLSGISLAKPIYLGAPSQSASVANTFSGDITLTLGEGFEGTVFTGNGKKGNMTGTVTVVADGVDLSKVTLTNAPGADNTAGTVAKGVLTYASGVATPVAGFDEYHIDTSAGGTVTLAGNLTVDKVIGGGTLELAGHTLTGKTAITTEGKLTVTDNTTDDFDVSNGIYGKLVDITGDVAGGKDYVKLNENSGISFHKAKLDITTVTLRPSATGIYYTGDFTYDDAVENGMDHYGIVTSLYETAPVVADNDWLDDDSTTGKYRSLYTRDAGTGALIANIMDGDVENPEDMKIYVRAYVQSGDDITYGETVSVTLRQLVQAIDKKFTGLNETQQEALKAMYLAYADAMADWKIPNLKNYAK